MQYRLTRPIVPCNLTIFLSRALNAASEAGLRYATLRGRLLEGRTARIPPPYVGMILREARHLAGSTLTALPPGSSGPSLVAPGHAPAGSYASSIAAAARASRAAGQQRGVVGGKPRGAGYGRKAAVVSDSSCSDSDGDEAGSGDEESVRGGDARGRRSPGVGAGGLGAGGAPDATDVAPAAASATAAASAAYEWPRKAYVVEGEFRELTYWCGRGERREEEEGDIGSGCNTDATDRQDARSKGVHFSLPAPLHRLHDAAPSGSNVVVAAMEWLDLAPAVRAGKGRRGLNRLHCCTAATCTLSPAGAHGALLAADRHDL